jgi:FkbM family methyltransferase
MMIKNLIKQYIPEALLMILTKLYSVIIFRDKPKYTEPPRELDTISCVIGYNKFGGYCIPKNSINRPAVQTTLRGKVWEEQTIKFILENYSSGDIVHAGTYFGDFLPALSINCANESVIWAFEPVREHYICAQMTLLLNNIVNVNLAHSGLGDEGSKFSMLIKDDKGGSLGGASSIVNRRDNTTIESYETINTVRLDDIIPKDRSISVIHLDVEGFEQLALDGAMKIIKDNLPLLILETLPEFDWLETNLFALGYKKHAVIAGNTVLKHHL